MTKATKNKTLLIVGIIALVGYGLLMRSCGVKSVLKTVGSDTILIIKRDTVQGKPILIRDLDTIIKWYKVTDHDTLEIPVEIPIPATDTLSELKRLQAVERLYNKKNNYIDTPRGETWKVDANFTVQKNELIKTGYIVETIDTSIHTTTVLTKPRNIVLSFKASAMGNLKSPLYAQGGGFELKLPNDATYSASIFKVWGEKQPFVMVTKGWPIRFGKRKD